MALKIKFDGSVFSKMFICLTVRPYIGAFLDGIGEANIRQCIAEGKLITDFIPAQQKAEWKAKMPDQYKEMIDGFSNQDVYAWFPPEYRKIIESCPNWQAWIRGQLNAIREFLNS